MKQYLTFFNLRIVKSFVRETFEKKIARFNDALKKIAVSASGTSSWSCPSCNSS